MPNITLAQARQMIQLYDANKATILKPEINVDVLAMSETFDRSDIDQLLAQEGCSSFRIYYGMSADLNIHAILVAVNQAGDDILLAGSPLIVEEGHRCPPVCREDAGLNS